MIVPWLHLVNDTDLGRSPKSPQKSINSLFWRSRSFKVIELSANREPVYDFLLVINSNLGPNSHRYWDTATYWPTIANFAHPSHLAPSFGMTAFEFMGSFTVPETRVFQAAENEDLVILACTVFDWFTRVTDGRTELRWLRRAESSGCFRA